MIAPKNKIILKRAISILVPIVLIIGVSCFFFIDVRWEEMTYEQFKNSIMTWILSYGGILLLTFKAFLTAISATRILKKPLILDETKIGSAVAQKTLIETTKHIKNKRNKHKQDNQIDKPKKVMGY